MIASNIRVTNSTKVQYPKALIAPKILPKIGKPNNSNSVIAVVTSSNKVIPKALFQGINPKIVTISIKSKIKTNGHTLTLCFLSLDLLFSFSLPLVLFSSFTSLTSSGINSSLSSTFLVLAFLPNFNVNKASKTTPKTNKTILAQIKSVSSTDKYCCNT